MISPLSSLSAAARITTAPLRLGIELAQGAAEAVAPAGERALLAALDAVVTPLMSEQAIDRVLARAETSGVAQRVVDRVLQDGVIEQIAERLLSGPELERILTAAFESALPDELIAQLLASEAVWAMIDEIARSPSVTEAITQQGTGFLEQVAAKARERARGADTRLERLAGRVSRRGRPGAGGSDIGVPPLPRQLPREGST
jgi:hypothetical protein